MTTVNIILKRPENGIGIFNIGHVVTYEVMNGTLTVEDYNENVWEFELEKIKEWSVE
ncbi:Uncharacterised protein [Anaerococcus prevotii]|uniref:Uncharacterized protein n=1 Tax=Anaerococcus prevotii (strain ATCC 9321 / DSM 20548 / JCM 6508 / NCTC 11806 / PC1) TaxID=525919 RepID=C7RH88_ANAPD|nr:hypothetical protein [Anaerococcus prevotii]ACV28849.1 hypothetical protein Apre_0821 [Anaerococcus prevotii DSM 20548]SUU94524.1 Uncharacterised protein [Anaerococcus prevotii]